MSFEPSGVYQVVEFLTRNSLCEFKNLSDITAIDVPNRIHRFEVVYNFLSTRYNSRVRVKTYADELSGLDSITNLHMSANWQEREVFDMQKTFTNLKTISVTLNNFCFYAFLCLACFSIIIQIFVEF